jgi:histidinol dehydrogenase
VNIESVVKDFKNLILAKGTPALNAINKQLGVKRRLNLTRLPQEKLAPQNKLCLMSLKSAILTASKNIQLVSETEKINLSSSPIETTKGINIWKEFRSIDSVGLLRSWWDSPINIIFIDADYSSNRCWVFEYCCLLASRY